MSLTRPQMLSIDLRTKIDDDGTVFSAMFKVNLDLHN